MNSSAVRLPVRRDEVFDIRLPSTPSTGYIWILEACPIGIEPVPVAYVPP